MAASKAKQKRAAKKAATLPIAGLKRPRKPAAKRPGLVRPAVVPEPLTDGQVAPIPGAPTDADIEAQLGPLSAEDRQAYTEVRDRVARHLGSFAAARLWFTTVGSGYAMTPLQAVREGRGRELLALLENQWGPNPTYA